MSVLTSPLNLLFEHLFMSFWFSFTSLLASPSSCSSLDYQRCWIHYGISNDWSRFYFFSQSSFQYILTSFLIKISGTWRQRCKHMKSSQNSSFWKYMSSVRLRYIWMNCFLTLFSSPVRISLLWNPSLWFAYWNRKDQTEFIFSRKFYKTVSTASFIKELEEETRLWLELF